VNFASWCSRHPWTALMIVALLWLALFIELWVIAPETDPTETVTVTCPVGTVQIVKIDGVWSCVQEGEAR